MSIILNNLPETIDFIRTRLLPDSINFLLLEGQLGAGKTTLTQALLKTLGVSEEVLSPTFGRIHEYKSSLLGNLGNLGIVHIDNYRSPVAIEELDDIIMRYNKQVVIIIEWFGLAGIKRLAGNVMEVTITVLDNQERLYNISQKT